MIAILNFLVRRLLDHHFISGAMTSNSEFDDFLTGTQWVNLTVFYNPNKMEESSLEREQDTNWFFLVFSSIVLAAGIGF